MSHKAVDAILDNSHQKGSRRLVLCILATYANDNGLSCYPSISTLARKANLTERQIKNHLKALEESGEITIHHKAGPRNQNEYDLSPVVNGEAYFTSQQKQLVKSNVLIVKSKGKKGEAGFTRSDQDPKNISSNVNKEFVLWKDTQVELKGQMEKVTFEQNLQGSVLSLSDDKATIFVKTPRVAEIVNMRLLPTIQRTLSSVAGRPLTVQVRVIDDSNLET